MKSRIIQDNPEPSGEPPVRRNLAARAAHWSAEHRRIAIFGWLAFVAVAVVLGGGVGKNLIHGADQFSGEAGDAEHTLEDAGLRPNDEHILIQSETVTIKDPQFRSAIEQATDELSQAKDVTNVVSPLTGDAPVSADGRLRDHGRLAGGRRSARPGRGRGCRGSGRSSRAARGAVRQCQLQQGAQRHVRVRSESG
jgi:uncharacterized membrane protein YdfJ with MMPL/SSD domain